MKGKRRKRKEREGKLRKEKENKGERRKSCHSKTNKGEYGKEMGRKVVPKEAKVRHSQKY